MLQLIAGVISAVFSLKTFASGALMIILGIILYNLAVDVVQEVMNFAITRINGVGFNGIGNSSFTGFAGWFLAQVKIPECIAVIVSCVSIKFILRKIPFLRW